VLFWDYKLEGYLIWGRVSFEKNNVSFQIDEKDFIGVFKFLLKDFQVLKSVLSANGRYVTLLAQKDMFSEESSFLRIFERKLLVSTWEFVKFANNSFEGSQYEVSYSGEE